MLERFEKYDCSTSGILVTLNIVLDVPLLIVIGLRSVVSPIKSSEHRQITFTLKEDQNPNIRLHVFSIHTLSTVIVVLIKQSINLQANKLYIN